MEHASWGGKAMKAWVQYTDALGDTRRYATPARRIYQLEARIRRLARAKPTNKCNEAATITIRIERDTQEGGK